MTWWRGRTGLDGWPPRALALAVLLAATAACLTGRGHHGSPRGLAVGLLITWIVVLAGTETALRGWRAGPDLAFRRWIGVAMLLWGAGQLVKCATQAAGLTSGFPGPGDLVQFAAAPLAVVGVVTIPRAVGGSVPLLRIALDSGLLSVCASLPVWRVFFADRPAGATGVTATVALMIFVEVVLAALAVVIAVRDLATPLLVLAVGVAAFPAGDLDALPAAPSALAPAHWFGQLLWVLSGPLIAWGTLRYRPGTRPDDPSPMDVDPDARVTVVTTTSGLLLLGLGVASMVAQDRGLPEHPRDAVSWGLVLGAIGLLWVRELLNTRQRVRLMGRLHEEATSDPLTGLANRRMLTARIAEVAPDDPWCLLALDIDGFKAVNDLLGHSVGDQLLCAVGNRLVRNVPRAALVSRIGGDEFAVLVPGGVDDGLAAAEQALAAVHRSCWDVEGVTRLPVSASVGLTALGGRPPAAADPGDGTEPLSPMSAAAAALQVAKAGGRDRIEVFDSTAASMRSRRLSVEERLRTAIREGRIDVLFQPVVDLRTGVITGVEALARWADDRLGPVHPQEFIPIAEQTGLVIELGELVLHRTLEQATEHGLPARGIRAACNVSPLQLRVPEFPRIVEEALAAHAMPPDRLLVEVTEAVLVDEDGPAVANLRRLAEAGVAIAIDDFGTGYSALGYLRRLPAHVLKIDKSLTSALVDEPQARAITAAVIELGDSLDVSVVVEGIETSDVAELVTGMGARYGQGALYGSAMPMSDIVRLSRRPPANLRPA